VVVRLPERRFIAVALAMVSEFLKAGLKMPIHFAFCCDEEVGCKGVRSLVCGEGEHKLCAGAGARKGFACLTFGDLKSGTGT